MKTTSVVYTESWIVRKLLHDTKHAGAHIPHIVVYTPSLCLLPLVWLDTQQGMFSWFPLYIPLRTPVVLKPGDKVSAHFWRCTSSTKVWYEWALTSPAASPIHNPNGRSYWIGL